MSSTLRLAKAQEILEHGLAVISEIVASAAEEIAERSGASMKTSLAKAQDVLVISSPENCEILGSAAEAIASKRGASANRSAANAHTKLERAYAVT